MDVWGQTNKVNDYAETNLHKWEKIPNKEIWHPVDKHSYRHSSGPCTLAEQLGDYQPWDWTLEHGDEMEGASQQNIHTQNAVSADNK